MTRTAAPAPERSAVVVACDESGAEGEKLVGGNTTVFAHAGVLLDAAEAAACVQELRDRIRSPATEYKATHLLRPRNRASLEWFLGPTGPVHGRSGAFLVEKRYFLLTRFAERLCGGSGASPQVRAAADTLYREGPVRFGPVWSRFLVGLNGVLRARSVRDEPPDLEGFFELAAAMAATGGPTAEVLRSVGRFRARPGVLSPAGPEQDPGAFPALDPLAPAIGRAVARWRDADGPVTVVHDQQTSLSEARIDAFERDHTSSLRLVPSLTDPRVQVADFLAGVARRLATDELGRSGDPHLTALLRPYIDPCSVWGDAASWCRLVPTPESEA